MEKRRADVATKMLSRAGVVAGRIEQGLKELTDPNVLEAFRLANKVMAAEYRTALPKEGEWAERIKKIQVRLGLERKRRK